MKGLNGSHGIGWLILTYSLPLSEGRVGERWHVPLQELFRPCRPASLSVAVPAAPTRPRHLSLTLSLDQERELKFILALRLVQAVSGAGRIFFLNFAHTSRKSRILKVASAPRFEGRGPSRFHGLPCRPDSMRGRESRLHWRNICSKLDRETYGHPKNPACGWRAAI